MIKNHKVMIVVGSVGVGILIFLYLRKRSSSSEVSEPLNSPGVGMGQAGEAANAQNSERELRQQEAAERKSEREVAASEGKETRGLQMQEAEAERRSSREEAQSERQQILTERSQQAEVAQRERSEAFQQGVQERKEKSPQAPPATPSTVQAHAKKKKVHKTPAKGRHASAHATQKPSTSRQTVRASHNPTIHHAPPPARSKHAPAASQVGVRSSPHEGGGNPHPAPKAPAKHKKK